MNPTRKKHWEIVGVSWDILNFIGFIGFNGFCLVGIINRYQVVTIEQRWPEKVLLMMSFPNSLVLETFTSLFSNKVSKITAKVNSEYRMQNYPKLISSTRTFTSAHIAAPLKNTPFSRKHFLHLSTLFTIFIILFLSRSFCAKKTILRAYQLLSISQCEGVPCLNVDSKCQHLYKNGSVSRSLQRIGRSWKQLIQPAQEQLSLFASWLLARNKPLKPLS